jgi:outer membrane lipoprotein-sorting protein
MKFLRTAPTRRLLASIAGLVAAIAAGTAIAVAATGSGPVPKPESLATALHQAATAPSVKGISARISFTNNLVDSSDFTSSDTADPILQGASGRLWLSSDHQLRIELQSNNGDAQVVVDKGSFWISDPSSQTVYEGTLPAQQSDKGDQAKSGKSAGQGVPSVAEIQSDLNRLMRRVDVSGARPSDVAGRPAYRVVVSPKHDGGLLGSAQLAWDAVKGVPLDVGIYARGNTSPVLELKATDISYGQVAGSVFLLTPPAGYKVTRISTPDQSKLAGGVAKGARQAKQAKRAEVSGMAAVAGKVPFKLAAPKSLVGLPRHGVSLLSSGGKPGAIATYGENLGGILVIEQKADANASTKPSGSRDGLSLPSVSINGVTGTELSTALGTVIQFTRNGVSYTVIGSVPAAAAQAAAQALPTGS